MDALASHSQDAVRHILGCIHVTGTGDVAECGVAGGGTSKIILNHLNPSRTLHLFDTFSGRFPKEYEPKGRYVSFGTEEEVRVNVRPWVNWKIHKGIFRTTFPRFHKELSFIYADADLYESTKEVIKLADRVLRVGGFLLLHDYQRIYMTVLSNGQVEVREYSLGWEGVVRACDEVLDRNRYYVITPTDSTCALAIKMEK